MPDWDEADDDSFESTVDAENDFETSSDTEQLSDEEREKGYLRHSDFTKKTQEVARLRKEAERALAIEQALQSDPAGTLAALAEQFGLSAGSQEDDLLPWEIEIKDLRNRVEAQERIARAEKLEAAALKAIATHDLGVEPDDLVRFMLANDIGNPEPAARLMALDKKSTTSAERKEKVTAAKRQLPSTTGGSRAATPPQKATSIREAFAMAQRQLGISD